MTIDIAMQGTRVIGGIAPRLRGAAGGTPPAPPQGVIQSFVIENTNNGGTSPGFVKTGLPFKKGDMPANCVPKVSIQGGAEITDIQFDERVSWMDGSLKFCVCRFKDTTFSASQGRTYDVEAATGTFDNAERISLATIKANSDVQVAVDNLKDATPDTTVGSGSFEAKFNDTVATRLTKVGGGKVCESWMGWIMFKDQTGGAEDAHLKAIFHIDAWNNGSNGIADYSYAVVLSQDWWEQSAKDRRTYNATLKDGATTSETYTSVDHHYHGQWATVRTDNDDQHAQRHWDGTIPTLFHKPDFDYWMEAGFIPPLETGYTSVNSAASQNTYSPFDNFFHRAAIDGTGDYPGRGIIPNQDCHLIVTTNAENARVARVNAFAGLHIGYHFRTNANRNRSSKSADAWNDFSGESSDVANTPISLSLDPMTASLYDFTSDGMPSDKHAYKGNAPDANDGGWQSPAGGTGVWTLSSNTSHAVNFCYFLYLYEGERWFLDATVDLATAASHNDVADNFGSRAYPQYYDEINRRTEFSIPATQYGGLASLRKPENSRSVGWSQVLTGSASAIVPDHDVMKEYIDLYNAHNSEWLGAGLSRYPTSQLMAGIPFHHGNQMMSAWMFAFQCEGAYHNYRVTENAHSKSYADHISKFLANLWTSNMKGLAETSRMSAQYITEDWDSAVSGTDYITDYGLELEGADVTNGSADITTKNIATFDWAVDDELWFTRVNGSGTNEVIPADIVEGNVYHVVSAVNTSGDNWTIQVSATRGGAAIVFGETSHCAVSARPAAANRSVSAATGGSQTVNVISGAAIMAYKSGSPHMTLALAQVAKSYLSTITTNVDAIISHRFQP